MRVVQPVRSLYYLESLLDEVGVLIPMNLNTIPKESEQRSD